MIARAKAKRITSAEIGRGDEKIFIDEHLTKHSIQLLLAAKDLVLQKKLTRTWVRNGKILIRETEDGAVVNLTELSQLNRYGIKKRNVDTRSPVETTPTMKYSKQNEDSSNYPTLNTNKKRFVKNK